MDLLGFSLAGPLPQQIHARPPLLIHAPPRRLHPPISLPLPRPRLCWLHLPSPASSITAAIADCATAFLANLICLFSSFFMNLTLNPAHAILVILRVKPSSLILSLLLRHTVVGAFTGTYEIPSWDAYFLGSNTPSLVRQANTRAATRFVMTVSVAKSPSYSS